MKCIAVGDLLIQAEWMRNALEKTISGEVVTATWGPNEKAELRGVIQRIERQGAEAEPWPPEIAGELAEVELLIVHLAPVPRALIERAPNLKLIASTRGGVENVDVEAASDHGVAVISNPAHNANAVAELTVGLMIAETRNIVRSHTALRAGNWREEYPLSGSIPEMRGSTVGLVGFGSIGRRVAELLRAFGARMLVSDPFVEPKSIRELGLIPVELPELLRSSVIVSLHARIPAGAGPLIGEEELASMREDAYLINTARSNAVDMRALRSALTEGRIAGAALDVFDVEPIPDDDPLLSLDRVTITNHRGSDTLNSYADSPLMVAEQAQRFFNGRKPRFLANPDRFPELSDE